MKNVVKVMKKEGNGFMNLRQKFTMLMLSDEKIKEGIFIDLQIRDLLKDDNFKESMLKKR